MIEDAVMKNLGDRVTGVCAIGVPDSMYGEVVGLLVTRGTMCEEVDEEQVKEAVKTSLHYGHIPKYVWFTGESVKGRLIPDIPLTASGKMRKNVVRDWVKDWI